MRYFDISMMIWEGMPVYPGDPSFELKWLDTIENCGYDLSAISMSSHCGTHVDCPRHFIKGGQTAEAMNVENFCGAAKLIAVEGVEAITTHDLCSFDIKRGEILILKTDNTQYMRSGIMPDKFACLTEDAAEYLEEKNIKAFGFDYITVDRDEDYPVHKTLLSAGIPIFEGLCLNNVQPDEYFFTGLPLRIKCAEASPVRAVLIKND